jgi:dihydroflavonol-4-reductase
MKVLVTGATGFLGYWMTRRLLDEGMEVRVLVRNRNKLEDLSTLPGKSIEIAEGDITNYDSLETACTGVQGVFPFSRSHRLFSRPAKLDGRGQRTRNKEFTESN